MLMENKFEETYKNQHKIETLIEEYEVSSKKQDDVVKQTNKRYYDLQKKCSTLEKEKSAQYEKITALEKDRKNATEKWLRLTTRMNNEGSKGKTKIKPPEKELEEAIQENHRSKEKTAELEQEINKLKSALNCKEETIKNYMESMKSVHLQRKKECEDYFINEKKMSEMATKIRNLEGAIKLLKEENSQFLENQFHHDSDSMANENQLLKSKIGLLNKQFEEQAQFISQLQNTNYGATKSMDCNQMHQKLQDFKLNIIDSEFDSDLSHLKEIINSSNDKDMAPLVAILITKIGAIHNNKLRRTEELQRAVNGYEITLRNEHQKYEKLLGKYQRLCTDLSEAESEIIRLKQAQRQYTSRIEEEAQVFSRPSTKSLIKYPDSIAQPILTRKPALSISSSISNECISSFSKNYISSTTRTQSQFAIPFTSEHKSCLSICNKSKYLNTSTMPNITSVTTTKNQPQSKFIKLSNNNTKCCSNSFRTNNSYAMLNLQKYQNKV